MPQGVRIVFHGGNATPVPALQKAGSQLIALPGCRSTNKILSTSAQPALARVAELRKRATVSPEEPWVARGPRTDSRPVNCERFSFDSKMVGTAIWGFAMNGIPREFQSGSWTQARFRGPMVQFSRQSTLNE